MAICKLVVGLLGLTLGIGHVESKDDVNLPMQNSCVCKLKGNVYNLTALGIPGPSPRPRVLSFKETKRDYQYFFNLCYPFSWPPVKRQKQKQLELKNRAAWRKNNKSRIPKEIDAYTCNDASLCQFDVDSDYPFFKAVTTQNVEDDMLSCVYNETIARVQWIYKGIGRLFKSGGMVVTLECDENVEKAEVTTQLDVDRRKGDPWKYISIKHKCCCPNKCVSGPQTVETDNLYVEFSAAGGGFLVLFLVMAIGHKIQQHCYEDQSSMPSPVLPHAPKRNYGTFLPKTIPYEEIEHIKQIGEGAFGIVSKARWRNSDVAVKRIKEHVIDEDIEPFIRESIWMSKLPHHNIVQFYGVCVLKPNLCIVTEYMEGGSVADVIHKQGIVLSWKKRIKWATDAAKGMTYLHSQTPPIIHRDLKSDNLLVDENGLVKVGDFGAVKLLEPLFARHACADSKRNTKSPTQRVNCDTLWVGTLRWSAPEVIPKRENRTALKYTPASDIYSFGITVWELISNRRPYYDVLWDYQIIHSIENGVRPAFPDGCQQNVIDFINRCWHSNPDVRPTFEDILKTLNLVRLNFENNGKPIGPWPSVVSQTSRQAAVNV